MLIHFSIKKWKRISLNCEQIEGRTHYSTTEWDIDNKIGIKGYSLFLRPSRTLYVRSVNAKSTGGLFGRCVIVFGCAGMICNRTAELFLDCKIPLESSAVEQFPSCFIVQRNCSSHYIVPFSRMSIVLSQTARVRNV